MRVLFAAIPAAGHFYPLVPLAWALRSAGHDVLVTTFPDFQDEVLRTGLPVALCSEPVDSQNMIDNMLRTPWDPERLIDLDDSADDGSGGDSANFRSLTDASLERTLGLVERWQPDLVVIEPAARAAELAAARFRIPTVVHTWGMLAAKEIIPLAEAARKHIGATERRAGVTEVPDPVLFIDTCPPTYQYPDSLVAQRMRYRPYSNGALVPDWALAPAPGDRACVTFGTLLPRVFGVRPLVDAVLEMATRLRLELVLAMDPRDLAGLPDLTGHPSVRAAGWFNLATVVPACDVVIHHGGSGSTLTALVNAVPQVVVPQASDHFANADRVQTLGIGAQVLGAPPDPDALCAAVETVLSGQTYRDRCAELAAEAAAQPAPAEVVGVLEGLAHPQLAGTRNVSMRKG